MAMFGDDNRIRVARLRGFAVVCGVSILALLAEPTAAQSNWFSSWSGVRRTVQPRPAVARVVADDGDGLSQGSGTLVATGGDYGIVITNWHVIRDATGPITAIFPDGFESAAQVLKTDEDWDLAALGIWRPSAAPIPVARIAPVAGEALTIAGYGPGAYREATGRLTQYVAPAPHLPYEMFEIDVEARNGDSGGPILNSRGELAGVLFGAATGTTAGSYCGRVTEFLLDVLPLIESPAARRLAQRPSAGSAGRDRAQPLAASEARDPAMGQGFGGPTPPATEQPSQEVASAPLEPVTLPDAVLSPETAPVAAVRSQPLPPAPEPRVVQTDAESPLPPQLRKALRFMGETPLDQVKTFLAIVGVVSIVMQLGRGRSKQ